jgi:membrane-associated protease RseP (regulator of RpoE activity)
MKVAFPLLALLCLAPVFAKDKASAPPVANEDKILVLEPFHIQGKPISSYAFDMRIYGDRETKRVRRILITRVLPNTDAEKLGLQPGDEIVKINGAAVKDLSAEVAPDSPLGRIFLNRDPGEPLDLDVVVHRAEKFTLHAQRLTLDPSP